MNITFPSTSQTLYRRLLQKHLTLYVVQLSTMGLFIRAFTWWKWKREEKKVVSSQYILLMCRLPTFTAGNFFTLDLENGQKIKCIFLFVSGFSREHLNQSTGRSVRLLSLLKCVVVVSLNPLRWDPNPMGKPLFPCRQWRMQVDTQWKMPCALKDYWTDAIWPWPNI